MRGLPHIDVPQFLRDPHSCKACKHSYFSADDADRRYMRCGKSQNSLQCRYERHESGACGLAAINWKARST